MASLNDGQPVAEFFKYNCSYLLLFSMIYLNKLSQGFTHQVIYICYLSNNLTNIVKILYWAN